MAASPQNVQEPKETLSEKEEIFQEWRNTIGLFVGPLFAIAIYLMDIPSLRLL